MLENTASTIHGGEVGASALAAEDRVVPGDEGLSSKSLALRASLDGFSPSEAAHEVGKSTEGVSERERQRGCDE